MTQDKDHETGLPQATGAIPSTHAVVGSYATYVEAQRAVDRLSDSGFPVADVRIVGHGLTSVEVVVGRLTKARAAGAGAASGIWLGLLVGLLIGLFTDDEEWFAVVLTAALLGAVWGAVLGFVAHWSTGGRRDFASTQSLVADRYDVLAPADRAGEARRLFAAPL
jgi:hypothetical protein